MTRDRLSMYFWIVLPAYIMVHVMTQVAPHISTWNTGVLSFVCWLAWMHFFTDEVQKYQKKQKVRRREMLREKINRL